MLSVTNIYSTLHVFAHTSTIKGTFDPRDQHFDISIFVKSQVKVRDTTNGIKALGLSLSSYNRIIEYTCWGSIRMTLVDLNLVASIYALTFVDMESVKLKDVGWIEKDFMIFVF